MNDKDLAFFQNIAEQILLYCAQSTIDNRETLKKVEESRKRFLLYREEREKNTMRATKKKKAPRRVHSEDSQLKKDEIITDGFLESQQEINQMLIKVPGVSICSKPRKDGRFQGYIVDGGKRTYVYGNSIADVANQLRFYLRYGPPKRIKKAENTVNGIPATFSAFTMYYFENFRKKKVAKMTYYNDVGRFNRYLKPIFGEEHLRRITPKACQNLIENIEKDGKGKTADEIHSLLSVIFKMAIKHGIITQNPLDIIFHVQHEKKHGKSLTKAEEDVLKNALAGSPLLPAFMILLYTGLRPNELASVKICGKFIVAINSKRKNKKVEYKRIPISKMLAPYLTDETPNLSSADYLRRKFKEILPDHILYDLRTTFYSRCKECGISEHARNAFMGHALGALGTAYTDLSDEFLIREMEKFEY